MKIKCIALCALFATSIASASSIDCEVLRKVAEAVMDARQNNVPLIAVLDATNNNRVLNTIAIAAYKQPVELTVTNKKRSAVKYGDLVYGLCVRNMKN